MPTLRLTLWLEQQYGATDRDEEVEAKEAKLDFRPPSVLQKQDGSLPFPVVLTVLQQRPA